MARFSVDRYPERESKFPFEKTGRTKVVTSYTTYEEQVAHKTAKGCEFLGFDMAVEGPKDKPIIVYRAFEVCKRKRK